MKRFLFNFSHLFDTSIRNLKFSVYLIIIFKFNMEEQGDDTSLETIVTVLENIERENLSHNQDIQNWLENITQPDFQLIDSMITLFLDNISDLETTATILKVLRYRLI